MSSPPIPLSVPTSSTSQPAQTASQAPTSQPPQTTQTTVNQQTIGANLSLSPSVAWIKLREYAREHKLLTLLGEHNWQSWRDNIQLTFQVCNLLGYVTGQLGCPDKSTDPICYKTWLQKEGLGPLCYLERQTLVVFISFVSVSIWICLYMLLLMYGLLSWLINLMH